MKSLVDMKFEMQDEVFKNHFAEINKIKKEIELLKAEIGLLSEVNCGQANETKLTNNFYGDYNEYVVITKNGNGEVVKQETIVDKPPIVINTPVTLPNIMQTTPFYCKEVSCGAPIGGLSTTFTTMPPTTTLGTAAGGIGNNMVFDLKPETEPKINQVSAPKLEIQIEIDGYDKETLSKFYKAMHDILGISLKDLDKMDLQIAEARRTIGIKEELGWDGQFRSFTETLDKISSLGKL